MMEFWEGEHYFGPDANEKIALANALVPEGFTRFEDWASRHMKPLGLPINE